MNVIEALDRLETQKGGLAVEEIWAMAWQVVDKLKSAQRPDATAIRLQSLINSQLKEQMPNRTSEQIMHSTNCVLFCVNYMLCANDEEPDPNQQVIDNLSRALSKMPDIVELFLAVEQMEDSEEARNNVVKSRNVLSEERKMGVGNFHDMQDGDTLILERLQDLTKKSLWQNGYTAESVYTGLQNALGKGVIGLSAENAVLSEKLWTLFRKRRASDSNSSFRITWLNIVGWCLKKGLLDGASPQLCNLYFPHAKGDTYKAIDKGRNGDVKAFVDIEPLLETYICCSTKKAKQ